MSEGIVAGLTGLSVGELRVAAVGHWVAVNRARLAMLDVFAELDRRGGFEALGLRALVDLVQVELRCTRKYARDVVRDVERYAGRVTPVGEPLPASLEVAASGLRDGAFSFAHAGVIAETVEKLPILVRAEHGAAVEATLAGHAAGMDPVALRTLAKRIVGLLNPDGPQPKEETQYRRRALRFMVNPDGTSRIEADLTATATAVWQPILAALAAIRNEELDADGNTVVGVDALGPDTRTHWQRQHDAIEEACRLLMQTGNLPSHAGLKTELLVTIDLRDLEARTGQATTHHGGTLTVQQVLHLAAEMNVIPVILDQELGLVQHGRGQRLATPPQRKAVFARDRGCTFPGCDKTAAQSEIHHMQPWLDQGFTNPDNLTLTCGYHNNEASRQGWKAQLIEGIPHWTPPRWCDPEQRPRRNWLHHPELVLRT